MQCQALLASETRVNAHVMSATDVSALLWRTWMKDLNLSQGYVSCSLLKTANIYVQLYIQQKVSHIWPCLYT
jgi:hypothetical protein